MAYVTKLIETYPGFGPDATIDGSMEDDPITNWPAAVGATAIETVIVHGGEKSIRLTAGANNDYISQSITVVAEQSYRILVWGYSSAAGHRWRVRIYVAGAVVWTGDWHDSAAWGRDEKLYRIPVGVTTIQLRLEIETAAEICYFDDVTIEQEAPVPMAEIDLMFRAIDDWSLWDQGIRINDPIIREIWGGELEDQLVRREEGKRVIPMELNLVTSNADTLIDDVNGLEEMLRHAAAFRMEGKRSGYGEVFLDFTLNTSTHKVWYPVIVGQLDKTALMKVCGSEKEIDKVPVVIICEAYWEADNTYDLNNYFDNPAFWRGATPPGDFWIELADPGGNLTLEWDRERFIFQCRSLKMIFSHDAVNNLGVASGGISARGETEFYWELRGFHPSGCDDIRASVYDLTGAPFEIAASVMTFDNQDDAWETLGTTFTTVAGNRTLCGYVRRMAVDSTAGDKEFWVDAAYMDEGATVPTGWCSAKDLVNHLDDDAVDINVLCVAEIPGEVEAEVSYGLGLVEGWAEIRMAKRIRNNPCKFKWQLVPCEGYTTAEGGAGGACQPGLIDAACIDTNKIIDANSPSGSRITCTFAGNQTMVLRAYWNINADFMSYYGRYVLAVLASKSANTDVVKMRVQAYNPISVWSQGYVLEETIVQAVANEWGLYDGWTLFSFPIGQHDDNLWDSGDRWQIRVYASITGAAAWDNLWIAGVYLIPVDDAYVVGGPPGALFGANHNITLKNLDGDRGLMVRGVTSKRHYNDVGAVGQIPLLSPEIENYLYFIINENAVAIADPLTVSVKYRPRGIFLRGTNP